MINDDIKELEQSLNDEYTSIPLVKVIKKINFNFNKEIIRFTPFIGRVNKNGDRDKIFHLISKLEFREKIKEKIKENQNKVNPKLFDDFEEKYKSKIYSQQKILKKAMDIKDKNTNYLDDIYKFLTNNGIMLFVETCDDKNLQNLDGFSCFYDDYKVIVIYEKEDKRRMLFTILHELYHLMYDENEKLADSFAGCALLTNRDVSKEYKNYDTEKYEAEYPSIIENLCLKHNVSVTSATKSLINYKLLSKDEEYYRSKFKKIRAKVEEKLKEKEKSIIINSL